MDAETLPERAVRAQREEPDRNRVRYRAMVWGAAANFASRGAGLVLMALTVHWGAPYLGPERFGVWATFVSLVAMLSFLDLGVGNALINRVAAASAKADADPNALRAVVTGGVGWLMLIGAGAAAFLALVSIAIPWDRLFKLSNAAVGEEARRAAVVYSLCFGVHLVAMGALKILIGQQRAWEGHLISLLANGVACVTLWMATQHQLDVPSLLAFSFGVQATISLSTLGLLRHRGLWRGPLWAAMQSQRSALLKTGGLYLILQIGTMFGSGSDSFLLASLSGADAVAVLAVGRRLFMLASQPVGIVNSMAWSAYADATARGDRRFVRVTLWRCALLSVGGALAMIVILLLTASWLVPLWTSDSIEVPPSLLRLLAVWAMIEVTGMILGAYLNGSGIVREQVIVVLCFCAVALPAKAIATMHAGALGLVAASIAVYLLVTVGLYATVFRRRIAAPLASGST